MWRAMTMIPRYECGFAVVNRGQHCWINQKCVVCNTKENIDKVKDVRYNKEVKQGGTSVNIKVNTVPSEYVGRVGYNGKITFITRWVREQFNG